jgi:hypothetical protein
MKNGKSSSLGMPMSPQEIIQEVQVSKLGDAPEAFLLHRQKSGHLSRHIFLLLHILCVFLGVSLPLLSVFFCFVCCNKWLDHIKFVLEGDILYFSLPRTL